MREVEEATEDQQPTIEAWSQEGVLLELYRYAPGQRGSLPKHSREKYQFCLSLDFPDEYCYRGNRYGVPMGSLSVIHPGEVHSGRDPEYRRTSPTFRMLYADPALLSAAVAEVADARRQQSDLNEAFMLS